MTADGWEEQGSKSVDQGSNAALISVVLPVHNRFECAQRAADSVLAQTYRPIELIVVDDASAQPFAPASEGLPGGVAQHVLRLQHNSGPGAAREAGRGRASGSLLAYLDSDDHWHPEFLRRLAVALQDQPEAGMAYCTALAVSEGRPDEVVKRSNRPYDRILPTMLWGRPWHTSSCLWRQHLTDRIGPWLPLWSWEDYEHDCRAGCLDTPLAHVAEPLCFVEREAPDRLAQGSLDRRTAHSLASSILAMAGHLRPTAWWSDDLVRRRMALLLLRGATQSARTGLRSRSLQALCQSWSWSTVKGPFAAPYAAALLAVLLAPRSVSVRLLLALRRRLPPAPNPDGNASREDGEEL